MSDEEIIREIERRARRAGFQIHPRFIPDPYPDEYEERMRILDQQKVRLLREETLAFRGEPA